MEAEEQASKQAAPKKMYTMKDLYRLLENRDLYSGFGKIPLSTKQNGASASFGTATRNVQQKVYSSKTDMKEFKGTRALPRPV